MLFLTFSIILTTLVIQGLSLPAIIRRLGVGGTLGADAELIRARRTMFEAALACLDAMEDMEKPEDAWIVDDLTHHYQKRLNLVNNAANGGADDATLQNDYHEYRTLSRQLRSVERAALIQLWTENQINDDVLRELERELDLEDARFASIMR